MSLLTQNIQIPPPLSSDWHPLFFLGFWYFFEGPKWGFHKKMFTFFALVFCQYTRLNLQTIKVVIYCCLPTVICWAQVFSSPPLNRVKVKYWGSISKILYKWSWFGAYFNQFCTKKKGQFNFNFFRISKEINNIRAQITKRT